MVKHFGLENGNIKFQHKDYVDNIKANNNDVHKNISNESHLAACRLTWI